MKQMQSSNFDCLLIDVTEQLGLTDYAISNQLITVENDNIVDNDRAGLHDLLKSKGVEFKCATEVIDDDVIDTFTAIIQSTSEPCYRCGGNQLYFVAVHNGHGVPARPNAGICYRCNGSGLEPHSQQTKSNQTKGVDNMNKELSIKVFQAMVQAISKKGATNKMVSTFDILDELKVQQCVLTHTDIRNILNLYIRLKYVRYYRNEKNYIYFGVTEIGYAKWALHRVQQALSQVATDSAESDELIATTGTITASDVQTPAKPKRKYTRKAKTA